LWRQQQELLTKHPDGVQIVNNSEDPLDIQANINGPIDTPYEKGIFRVKIIIPNDFPQAAPKGKIN
jgi:ubiquitin-conjugating enzyme E2 S